MTTVWYIFGLHIISVHSCQQQGLHEHFERSFDTFQSHSDRHFPNILISRASSIWWFLEHRFYCKMRRRRSGMVLQHASVIRVVILGKKGVGKSALTVRFMTKRFIGEYDSSSDETWKHMALIDEEHVPLEINDTTGECSEEKLDLYVGCGDIFVIMYSITDEESLEHARHLGESVQRKKPDATENIVLVGTKTDLEHLRRVDFTSAQETANDLQCLFQEISISEGYEQVETLFQELLRRYSKKSSSHKAPVKSILKKKQKSKDNLSKGSLRKKSMHNSVPILE